MNVNTENKKIIPIQPQDEKQIEQAQLNIQEVVEALNKIKPELGDFAAFTQLFTIPEQGFKAIEPVLLDEFERTLNFPENCLEIARMLNISNLKKEDYSEIINALDESLSEALGEQLKDYQIDFLKKFFALIFKCAQDCEAVSKRIIPIPIELCHPDAKIPDYANIGDAGMDAYALDDYTIMPGETKLIPTGIKLAIPKGYEIQIRPKSGRALKTKLRVANTPATIDSGYRQEIGVIVENVEPPIKDITYDFDENGQPIITSILRGKPFYIEKGTKFAQLVLNEIPIAQFFQVEDITQYAGDRGGGFGSSSIYSKENNRKD